MPLDQFKKDKYPAIAINIYKIISEKTAMKKIYEKY